MNAVKTGLDILLQDPARYVGTRYVGLITNASGVTRDLRPNIDALRQAGVNLVALFSPEHGLLGAAREGESVTSSVDAHTGLPVYSLYGETRKPTREMLANIDVLLFDLQDVGVRFYTYTTTLALVLEACAENQIPLIVLDRPNPINGNTIEGPMLDPALQSFVGHGPLPIRYGMTIGELAQFYNHELNIGAELQIIAMEGWRREMWFDETGLPWVLPSPNLPTLSTAAVYPGMCLLEGTNLSLGRGTALPFEIVGAPWLEAYTLAEAMNALDLAGVRFRPMAFVPNANQFANVTCYGVQVHALDRYSMRPVTMALHLIRTLRQLYPAQFEWRASFDRLIGDASVRHQIEQGETVANIVQTWTAAQHPFKAQRPTYLLYPSCEA
jgi:uncharacterized protein YbbC (DUF1343 family)